MKSFAFLCALAVACCAQPNSYGYPSYSPLPYFYAPRAVSGFSYSVAETPLVTYPAPAQEYAYPVPAVSYVEAAPAARALPQRPIPQPYPYRKAQYHSQDSLGQARYGHDEPGQSHHAIQDAAGNKFGTFSYIKPDGKVSINQYTADAEGYKVASNDLPVGPGSPAPAPVLPVVPVLPAAPVPVAPVVAADAPVVPVAPVESADTPATSADSSDDTIQVENVERSKRSIRHRRSAVLAAQARSAVLPSGYLADTPEVASAKAAHFAEYARASSAAAAPYFYYSPLSYNPYAYAGNPYAYAAYPYAAYPYSYTAAPTVVTADGYLADTPEVAAAKAAHFAEHAAARSRSSQ